MGSVQAEGWIGKMVGAMIRRSVRQRFRAVYWVPPSTLPEGSIIWAANHHGWHDGYLMFHVVEALGKRSLDWIAEFDAFPLFAHAGGMPFPPDKPEVRAATLKKTVRLMKTDGRSLILFPEGTLHEPPEVWSLGDSLAWLGAKVPAATVLPVGLVYRMSKHERPQAYIQFSSRTFQHPLDLDEIRHEMQRVVNEIQVSIEDESRWQTLVQGTRDVNERWDFRSRYGKK